MINKMFTGGFGRRYLRVSRLKVSVVGGGSTKGKAVVYVHPDDYEAAQTIFQQSSLDSTLKAMGDGLVVGSVFSSAFQGITLLGLLAGKSPGGAARELVERAFPDLPSQTLHFISRLHDQAVKNHLLATRVLSGLGPGGGGGGGSGGGARRLRPRVGPVGGEEAVPGGAQAAEETVPGVTTDSGGATTDSGAETDGGSGGDECPDPDVGIGGFSGWF